MPNELEALGSLVFRAYERPHDVWRDDVVHVDELHSEALQEVLGRYRHLKSEGDVANVRIEGRPGVGKTHFLGRLRAHVLAQRDFFVYVDLSSVRRDEFWQTLVGYYLDSLSRLNGDRHTQLTIWTAALFCRGGLSREECARLTRSNLSDHEIASIREALHQYFGNAPRPRTAQDVAIALMLQASDNGHTSDVGLSFLRGLDIESDDKRRYGFQTGSLPAREVVSAIDFLMAKAGMVSVVCLDQLDQLIAIQPQAEAPLLDQIANGLMDLAQECQKSLVALSCLQATWRRIETQTVPAVAARYPGESRLHPIPSPKVGRSLIAAYFGRAYGRVNFSPPYPTWPIDPTAFEDAADYTPRRLIELSEAHARACRQAGAITELERFPGDAVPPVNGAPGSEPPTDNEFSAFTGFDADYAAAREATRVDGALDETHVDAELPKLLQAGLASWIDENDHSRSFAVDPLPGRNPSLHARIKQEIDCNTGEEAHWSLRAVVSTHPSSAQRRLRDAMTASGLGLAHGKRNLIILRNQGWSNGPKTQTVLGELKRLGGVVLPLDPADLIVFEALKGLRQRHGDAIAPWLRARRPASKTALLKAVFGDPDSSPAGEGDPSGSSHDPSGVNGHGLGIGSGAGPNGGGGLSPQSGNVGSPPTAARTSASISLGTSPEMAESIDVRLEDLRRHTAIFAGSGSGKTVLIRRLVEECALAGVSSIVLDPNNDLARLGEPWPEPPAGWRDGDAERAQRYFDGTEVVIWTPRRTTGRPLTFQPMGDLSAVADDADEFDIAIDNAVATLLPRAGLPRSGAKADQGQAVLREALRQFVRNGGSDLKPFLSFLGDLPADVSRIADAPKIAHAMAQTLLAATVNDPLFGGEGEPIDPGVLLTPSAGRTARVSVISLIGLPNDDQRQSFVNQLQMALFAWAKRNPAGDRPLGALYVMDEAQTFAPSSPATACSQSTRALAAQARKYGLGLVFATQAPKGLHNQIVGNATTQLYGFMNAPAQITAVKEIAAAKGGDVPDISRLKPGLFYIGSDAIALQKIATPNCLSYHPKSPLTPMEVLTMAAAR